MTLCGWIWRYRVGFFSQLEQYASSHHWRPANQQFEGREHKHCTVRIYHNKAGEGSKATIAGEASQGRSNPKPGASPEIGRPIDPARR